MTTKHFLTLGICLCLLAACQDATDALTHRAPNDSRQEALRQASAEWDRLFNAGDATGLALLYAEDAISMPPNNHTIQGRQALLADFDHFFRNNTARHETRVDRVLMDGDLAIEAAHYRLMYSPRSGGNETLESGRHLEVRRKIKGEWQIVLEIWNADTPK